MMWDIWVNQPKKKGYVKFYLKYFRKRNYVMAIWKKKVELLMMYFVWEMRVLMYKYLYVDQVDNILMIVSNYLILLVFA